MLTKTKITQISVIVLITNNTISCKLMSSDQVMFTFLVSKFTYFYPN